MEREQEIRKAALEQAIEICEGERLGDGLNDPTDLSYEQAIDDCVHSLRKHLAVLEAA